MTGDEKRPRLGVDVILILIMVFIVGFFISFIASGVVNNTKMLNEVLTKLDLIISLSGA